MHATSARPSVLAHAVATATATTIGVLPAPASAMPAQPEIARPAVVHAGLLEGEIREAVRAAERRVRARQQRQAKLRAERRAQARAAAAARSRADSIIGLAAREAGDPYVYGAAGSNSFDCSGYTMYVFGQLGISLPHSSSAQASMARRVSDPQVGDLVFFGGAHVYHVAIYAGDGYVWHAPRTGDVVKKERIWTGDVFYGRVG